MLGKVENQHGHAEEALRVFSGINMPALIPKVKMSIIRKVDLQKAQLHSSSPSLPFHAAILLLEIIYFKATALRNLGKIEGICLFFSLIMKYFARVCDSIATITSTQFGIF